MLEQAFDASDSYSETECEPVFFQNSVEVEGYFPDARWYDFHTVSKQYWHNRELLWGTHYTIERSTSQTFAKNIQMYVEPLIELVWSWWISLLSQGPLTFDLDEMCRSSLDTLPEHKNIFQS